MLKQGEVTTNDAKFLSIGEGIDEVTICCHSDTPVLYHYFFLIRSDSVSSGCGADSPASEVIGRSEQPRSRLLRLYAQFSYISSTYLKYRVHSLVSVGP